ncbi:MAG: hypothetical protein ACE5PV_11895, partial [Candidatus Poribacteria bacterium]
SRCESRPTKIAQEKRKVIRMKAGKPLYVVMLSVLILIVPAYSATIFYDDFEGGLEQWEVVSGQWKSVERQGNWVMELTLPVNVNSKLINIKARRFDDFTVETRINQVTGDAGAHLYFRNNAKPGNNGEGYWFGFITSAWRGPVALQDTVHFWKVLANPQELLRIPLKLPGDQWLRLKVEARGKHAKMWYQREDIDDDYILVFETDALVEFEKGKLGIWGGGQKVWVDYILVYDAEGPSQRPVNSAGKLALRWGEVKIRSE